jgi:hypothetical protein
MRMTAPCSKVIPLQPTLYPFLWLFLNRRLFGRRANKRVTSGEASIDLHKYFFCWMIRPATLLGRITIMESVKNK